MHGIVAIEREREREFDDDVEGIDITHIFSSLQSVIYIFHIVFVSVFFLFFVFVHTMPLCM